jgi:hypothetical protein
MDENVQQGALRIPLNSSLVPRDSTISKDALLQNCFIDESTAEVSYTTKRPGFYVGTEAITTGLNRGVYYNPYDGGTYYIDENEALQKIETSEILLFQTGFQTLYSLGPSFNVFFIGWLGTSVGQGYGIMFKETSPGSFLYTISFGRFTGYADFDDFAFTPITTISTGITPADIYSIYRTESPLSNVVNFYVNFTKVGSASYIPYSSFGGAGGSVTLGTIGSSFGVTPP